MYIKFKQNDFVSTDGKETIKDFDLNEKEVIGLIVRDKGNEYSSWKNLYTNAGLDAVVVKSEDLPVTLSSCVKFLKEII